jgi:hypothetical protein
MARIIHRRGARRREPRRVSRIIHATPGEAKQREADRAARPVDRSPGRERPGGQRGAYFLYATRESRPLVHTDKRDLQREIAADARRLRELLARLGRANAS